MVLLEPNVLLDEMFGICIEGEIRPHEQAAAPIRCYELNAETASILDGLRKGADANPLMHHCFVNLTILWLVTPEGAIKFCIEQSIEGAADGIPFPRTRGVSHGVAVRHLGHPMLCEDGWARIAGEIYLDQGPDGLYWVLTNKSGRFGSGHDRKDEHLENVAAQFAFYGIEMETDFS
ncbi:MAG: hypothetical protein WBB98_17405 [Xanthobacteraceae bacterium]